MDWSALTVRSTTTTTTTTTRARAPGTGQGGARIYGKDASYWIGELLVDGVLRLSFAWPQAGLPLTSTTVLLHGLADLAEQVVALP